MIVKKYLYRTEFYSYFLGHNKYEYHEFDTLSDALKSYHDDLAHDFDYGDAYHSTHPVIYYFKYISDPASRPHARTRAEWEKMCETSHDLTFDTEEILYLLSLSDVDNDDVLV